MKAKLFITLALFGTMAMSCREDKFGEKVLVESDPTIFESPEGKVKLKQDILEFENTDVLQAFKKKIANDDAFKKAIQDKSGNTLLMSQVNKNIIPDSKKEILDNLSPEYSYVLNKDAAYIVGKEYVIFGTKNQYAIDKEKRNEINWANEDAIDPKKVFIINYGKVSINTSDKSNTRADFGLHADAIGGQQHEFFQQTPTSGNRKWIDEIYSRQTYLGTAPHPNG